MELHEQFSQNVVLFHCYIKKTNKTELFEYEIVRLDEKLQLS